MLSNNAVIDSAEYTWIFQNIPLWDIAIEKGKVHCLYLPSNVAEATNLQELHGWWLISCLGSMITWSLIPYSRWVGLLPPSHILTEMICIGVFVHSALMVLNWHPNFSSILEEFVTPATLHCLQIMWCWIESELTILQKYGFFRLKVLPFTGAVFSCYFLKHAFLVSPYWTLIYWRLFFED